MTKILLDTLIPIFAGLLLGYVAGRRGTMDNRNVRDLIVLVMDFAIPCALFSTIIGSSRTSLLQHVPAALMITLVFCALYLISYIWARRWRGMSLSDASVLALTIGFPNSAAIALPLFRGAYGPESTVTAALSIVIGSITISPLTLALLEAAKHSGGNHVSATQILRSLPRALLQPVVWAPLVALFGVFSNFMCRPSSQAHSRLWGVPQPARPWSLQAWSSPRRVSDSRAVSPSPQFSSLWDSRCSQYS